MERYLVAVANCLHGHDVVNRMRATYPMWQGGLDDADKQVSHLDVTAACRVLADMYPLYRFVDTMPYTNMMQDVHLDVVGCCEGATRFVLTSRVQPNSQVVFEGDAGTLVPVVTDLLMSGLYELLMVSTELEGGI